MTRAINDMTPIQLIAIAAQLHERQVDVLLQRFPDLGEMAQASVDELAAVWGMTHARAQRVAAALRLGRLSLAPADVPTFRQSADLGPWLVPRYGAAPVEQFGIVALGTKLRLLGVRVLMVGNRQTTVVHPRDVMKAAVDLRANALVLFHNHPSADPTPSPDDFVLTTRLRLAGELLGIEVVDHLILSPARFVSLRAIGGFADVCTAAQGD